MYLPEEPDEEFELNIVPMIDVIFAILTFFIVSSLFLTRSEAVPVTLPTATQSETQSRPTLAVTVDAAGAIFINQRAVTLEELPATVQAAIAPTANPVVVINADAGVNHGRVIAVMDQLRTLEGISLGIATQSPVSTP